MIYLKILSNFFNYSILYLEQITLCIKVIVVQDADYSFILSDTQTEP